MITPIFGRFTHLVHSHYHAAGHFDLSCIPANLVNHLINRAHVFAPLEVHLPMIELRLHLWGPRFDQGNTDGFLYRFILRDERIMWII